MHRFSALRAVWIVAMFASSTAADDEFVDRLFLRFGGMRAGSGIAGGLEYRDSHFGNEVADLRLESKVSIRLYQRHEIELIFPHFRDPRLFIDVSASYRSHTQIDYFGIGADSSRDNHSNYRVDGITAFTTLGFRPSRKVQVGARVGYIQSILRQGTDSTLPTVDEEFDPVELPGITDTPDHAIVGGFFAYDYRDDASDPNSGGIVEVQAVRYLDTAQGNYGFDEVDIESQYFVTVAPRTRLGLRFRSAFTRARAGHELPFYLLPSIGGSDSLHAFENDRFRDGQTIVLNHELRYRATPAIGLELFVDAGQVAPRVGAFELGRFELSYGGGVRYILGNSVLAGVSLGFGREGARLSFNGNFRF